MVKIAYLNTTDIVGILLIVGIFIFTGMLFTTGVIDNNTFILVFLGVFGFIVAKYSVPLAMAGLVQRIYGKGMVAYWAEIKKEIMESTRNYEFSYDLMLPERYMPKHSISLSAFGLVLFEINRDDMATYAGEREDILAFPYHYLTILYDPAINQIVGIRRGATLDDTVEWIKDHKEMFQKEERRLLIPQAIERFSFGEPIEVKVSGKSDSK